MTFLEFLGRLLNGWTSPPPPPQPPPTPGPQPPPESDTTAEGQVVQRINAERARLGLPTLAHDPGLSAIARSWAHQMADRRRLDHGDSAGRIGQVYPGKASGEVIAEGQRTPDEVVNAWWNHGPHRQILVGRYDRIGVGVAKDVTAQNYWVADLAAS